jgi:hypothetical protein
MYWIIAVLVLVLALTVPKFRRAGVIIAVVLLALLGWAIQRSSPWTPTPEATQQREASRPFPGPVNDSPPLSAVSAERLQLTGGGAPWTLAGRLTNTSQRFRVTSVTLKIERRDCYADAPDPSGCVLQWQGSETVFVDIPPGEWREFSSAIWLHGGLSRTRGETRDAFQVTNVDGKRVAGSD